LTYPAHAANRVRFFFLGEVERIYGQPQSGERMQPMAQAVGGETGKGSKPRRGERISTVQISRGDRAQTH